MGRQTAIETATGAGASASYPLDPGSLPAIFESRAGGMSHHKNSSVPVQVHLDRESLVLKGRSVNGPINVVVGIQTYSGVMVQITPADEAGSVSAKLILKHPEDGLSVVLAETDNPEELASAWPAWSKSLDLPMLVCDLGGAVKPIEAYSVRTSERPASRRKLALLTGRRPRFLVRRKVGQMAARHPVHRGEREIIARN